MKKKINNKQSTQDIFKNAHIALQSISDLLPIVKDRSFKTELKNEYEGYKKVIDEISEFMLKNRIKKTELSGLKKTGMLIAIKSKTLFDKSSHNIANMMMKGSLLGMNDLQSMLNDEAVDEEVLNLAQKLLELENAYFVKLKAFL